MKIGISTMGNDLDAAVDPRFGRCQNYIIADTDNSTFEVVYNDAQNEGHGAGLRAAQILVNKGVQAVISGNVGPNAFTVLENSNIVMYSFAGKIGDAITQLKSGSLPKLTQPRKAAGAGMGRGGGGGRGRN
ncbi:MAG: NifB/NifX family molybdenum-iron cluster-binding protein [Candidatus Heimdallarchaeota archaeon]